MKKRTYLADAIETADIKAQYDKEAKRIVADKGILSWIVRDTVKEPKDCTLQEIEEAIEGIEISSLPVYPGRRKPEAITGMPLEDKVPGEGMVTYDIRFYVVTPKGEKIRLLLNVEIQRDYYPGYDLVTRAVFYCARMLSAQLDTEFTAENYDDIKKVYSIWLCLNSPKKEADTIVEYSLKPRTIYGNPETEHRYDLLSVVMVGLNEESYRNRKTPLHGFLGTVFSEKLKAEEKLRRLETDYGVSAAVEVKEGVNRMCNLSDAIEERGIQKGLAQGEEQKLIELICKKVKKGKKPEEIAEELEEEIAFITPIYEAALNAGLDYDCRRIYELLHSES